MSNNEKPAGRPLLTKPTPTTKVPTGQGYTKGDLLLRRLQYEFNFDPLQELVALAKSNKTSVGEKIKISQELMGYIVPKLKNVEVNQHQGEVIRVNIMFPTDENGAAGLPKLDVDNSSNEEQSSGEAHEEFNF